MAVGTLGHAIAAGGMGWVQAASHTWTCLGGTLVGLGYAGVARCTLVRFGAHGLGWVGVRLHVMVRGGSQRRGLPWRSLGWLRVVLVALGCLQLLQYVAPI